jgi:hypothetical protein
MGEMPVLLLTVEVCRVVSEAGWSLAPGAGVPCRGNRLNAELIKGQASSLTGFDRPDKTRPSV